MSSIQPGVGYRFSSSSRGTSIDTSEPFPDNDSLNGPQFQTVVISEPKEGGGFKYFVKVRRGVVNFNFSKFPWYLGNYSSGPDGGTVSHFTERREHIIKDFGVYPTGSRTAGSDTLSDWMASDGKIEIKNASDGGFDTWVIGISKIDYYDDAGWYPTARLLATTEAPFLSVYAPDDPGAGTTNNAAFVVEHQAVPSRANVTWYLPLDPGGSGAADPASIQSIPLCVGYDFKKIAQLDWNSTTSGWDLTQYLLGPIWLDVPFLTDINYDNSYFDTSSGTAYELFQADQFVPMGNSYNSDWFERLTGTISGYTINSSSWWTPVVGP